LPTAAHVGAALLALAFLAGCSKPVQPSFRQLTDFGDLWGTSPNDVYAFGLRMNQDGWHSLLLHYDGRRWSTSFPDAPSSLTSMWGTSTEQFIVGFIPFEGGRILHRTIQDGHWTTQTRSADVELFDVWGTSPNDVFAVGDCRTGCSGAILHYDGVGWSTQNDTVDVRGVWGTSGNNVYAVGEGIYHYDGVSWTTLVARTPYLFKVWGSSGSDVFAVGSTIMHYDGAHWTTQVSDSSGLLLSDVWGSSSSDVFAVGFDGKIMHYDGHVWSSQTSGTTADLIGVWGSSPHDVYAVGYEGAFVHYNGSTWSPVSWDPLSWVSAP